MIRQTFLARRRISRGGFDLSMAVRPPINFPPMNVLILAAGYATRLYPLTEKTAKPLLKVAGKPMIEWVTDNLADVPGIAKICIVTNDKFAADFQHWADEYRSRHPALHFEIINDGSTNDSNKLGAIGDINLAISRENLATAPLLVVAGDNLFNQSLAGFVTSAQDHPATLATYDVQDLEAIKKYANVETDDSGKIVHFEEKPAHPKNSVAGIALYYFSPEVVGMFATYLAAGNNPDQPGRFIQWLYPRVPVRTHLIGGIWYDIGSQETLEEANRIFAGTPEKGGA